jgi:NADH dehydrogenase FAD-containing subunit
VKIVLAGAGHTHIELLRQGALFSGAGHELVLVSPDASHPYSGMAPGVLGGSYRTEEIMLPASELASRGGVTFIRDRVRGLDPPKKVLSLEGGGELSYDLLSLNLGSETVLPVLSGQNRAVKTHASKPIASLLELKVSMERIATDGGILRIAVIGGGPAGVELAGNISAFMKDQAKVDLYTASSSGLGGYAGKGERFILSILKGRGVTIHKERRIEPADDLAELEADIVLFATGVKAPGIIKEWGLPLGENGGIKVNRFLQVEGFPEICAAGDCACFYSPRPGRCLERIGVYAVRQQSVLQHNLLSLASGGSGVPGSDGLKGFKGDRPSLSALNLGGGIGILQRGSFLLAGRAAFFLKDFIDRRFMAKYQRYQHV